MFLARKNCCYIEISHLLPQQLYDLEALPVRALCSHEPEQILSESGSLIKRHLFPFHQKEEELYLRKWVVSISRCVLVIND